MSLLWLVKAAVAVQGSPVWNTTPACVSPEPAVTYHPLVTAASLPQNHPVIVLVSSLTAISCFVDTLRFTEYFTASRPLVQLSPRFATQPICANRYRTLPPHKQSNLNTGNQRSSKWMRTWKSTLAGPPSLTVFRSITTRSRYPLLTVGSSV